MSRKRGARDPLQPLRPNDALSLPTWQLHPERLQNSPRFGRPVIDAHGAEGGRVRALRRPIEDRRSPGDGEVLEARSLDDRCELCFQQSTCDSTGPQVDPVLRLVGDRTRHQDVGDLNAPAGPEHPVDLGEGRCLVRAEPPTKRERMIFERFWKKELLLLQKKTTSYW